MTAAMAGLRAAASGAGLAPGLSTGSSLAAARLGYLKSLDLSSLRRYRSLTGGWDATRAHRGARGPVSPALLPPASGSLDNSASCCQSVHSRCAATLSGQSDDKLMPEDILQLRATSMTIMQDPICEIRPEEVEQYHVNHVDEIAELPLWHPRRIGTSVTQPFRHRKLAAQRFTDLMIERIDNDALCRTFEIDSGFNMQVYFMMVHAWLLHQRLVLEGSKAKKLDEDMFESCWTMVRNWMWLKKIPEYRFDAELHNVQEYMLGFCIAMDKALERPDILPARLQQSLWANMYSGAVKRDAAALTRLTKYCLRQLGLMLALDAERFLTGSFAWADFPIPDQTKLPARTALPLWREEFSKTMKEVKASR